jgi:hypothetical protein
MLQKEDQDGTKIALPVQLLILVSCVAAICLSVTSFLSTESCASQYYNAPSTVHCWLASDLSRVSKHYNSTVAGISQKYSNYWFANL